MEPDALKPLAGELFSERASTQESNQNDRQRLVSA
jgi:hypothetical protein